MLGPSWRGGLPGDFEFLVLRAEGAFVRAARKELGNMFV